MLFCSKKTKDSHEKPKSKSPTLGKILFTEEWKISLYNIQYTYTNCNNNHDWTVQCTVAKKLICISKHCLQPMLISTTVGSECCPLAYCIWSDWMKVLYKSQKQRFLTFTGIGRQTLPIQSINLYLYILYRFFLVFSVLKITNELVKQKFFFRNEYGTNRVLWCTLFSKV